MTQNVLSAEQIQRMQEGAGLYSQARNFLSHVSTGVDARTGQFTMSISIPVGMANNMAGPSASVGLHFSPMASLSDKGFGLGWSLAFSSLDLRLNVPATLSLSSGEQLSIDRDNSDFTLGGRLAFFDQKLDSVRATRIASDCYEIVNKVGEIERLYAELDESLYITREMRSQEGRRITFAWGSLGDGLTSVLKSIRDDSRTLFSVERSDGQVLLVMNPDTEHASTLTLTLLNNQLKRVILPDAANSHWEFTYSSLDGLLFPIQVNGPLGSEDLIDYSRGNDGHLLPPGAPLTSMPRVSTHRHNSATGQPYARSEYEWRDSRNFFGFGAEMPGGWVDGQDNLYRIVGGYEYSVTESQFEPEGLVKTIVRTWNRFHLQTREVTTQGSSITDVVTEYDEDPDRGWEYQPAWCQLPIKVSTTYRDASGSRTQSTETTYDAAGNILTSRDVSGVLETREYFPVTGETGRCPPDPHGFVRWLKSYKKTPAKIEDGSTGGAPVLSAAYTYEVLPSLLDDGPPCIVSVSEAMTDETAGTALETTEQTYITDKGPHHGNVQQAVTTLNGLATTTRFDYQLVDDQLRTETRTIGFENDDVHTAMEADARSIHTGLTVMQQSYAGVQTLFEFDTLGRAVKTTIAPGSRYEATRTCTFQLTGKARAMLPVFEETDVNGTRRRTWLDGDGREVRVELEDVDTETGLFREVSRTVYDLQGRVIEETSLDWFPGQDQPLTLTRQTVYDDWGNATAVTDPDGVITRNVTNPITLETQTWKETKAGKRSAKTVTTTNLAGSPVLVRLYDSADTLVRTTHVQRDGLDRVIEERVSVPGEADIVTATAYDAFDRVLTKTLADGTQVHWTYAAHSDGDHPETVSVTTVEDSHHEPA